MGLPPKSVPDTDPRKGSGIDFKFVYLVNNIFQDSYPFILHFFARPGNVFFVPRVSQECIEQAWFVLMG